MVPFGYGVFCLRESMELIGVFETLDYREDTKQMIILSYSICI